MSWTLVNRGLELFESDLPESSSQNKESKPHTRRHGFKKHTSKKELAEKREKEAKQQLIQKKVVSAFEKRQKNRLYDQTQKNLKLLQSISKGKTSDKYMNEVREKHLQELEKKTLDWDKLQQKKKKQEEKSVFTDEDFERVNEEWLRL